VIEPRIYRAAFLPAVFAVILVMFSLENRPRPVQQGLAADVIFDGNVAFREMRQIVEQRPDRRPGSASSAAIARDLATSFRALRQQGFETKVDSWEEDGKPLVNVVATRAGETRDQIVVMAARDSQSVPDATGSASDTAALLELARVIKGRPSQKTIVLASVDGSSLGDAGARRFAETAEDRDRIEEVIVLSNLGASSNDGPMLIQWSNDERRGSIGLRRTAAASLREELGRSDSEEGAIGQYARLAYPLGIGAQGPLLADGIEAIRLSGSGELSPPDDKRGVEDVDVDRLGALGRSALRLISALDAAREPPEHGPESYLLVSRKVLPGWVLGVLALAFLLPALIASFDAYFRARRRGEAAPGWWRAILLRAVPFVVAWGVAELVVVLDQAPNTGGTAPEPSIYPVDGEAIAALGLSAAAAVLAWFAVRSPLKRRAVLAGTGGAGALTSLAFCTAVLLIWVLNPFAALLLVPAAHIWMLAMLSGFHLRLRGALMVAFAGLVLPLLALGVYLERLSLDPIEGLWYLWLLITGNSVSPLTTLLSCLVGGIWLSVVAVLAARALAPRSDEDKKPSLRGPGGYIGPGALGGTSSTLSRR
jgi:hypothetical protein